MGTIASKYDGFSLQTQQHVRAQCPLVVCVRASRSDKKTRKLPRSLITILKLPNLLNNIYIEEPICLFECIMSLLNDVIAVV